MKRFQTNILKLCFMAFFMTTCSDNEEDLFPGHLEGPDTEENIIMFSSDAMPHTNMQGDTEETETWKKLYDRRIAVEIDGNVRLYKVTTNGELSSEEPFYWNGNKQVTVTAWYPYNQGEKPSEVIVKADQSIESNYWASHYMEAVSQTVNNGEAILKFQPLTAKVICSIQVPEGSEAAARFAQVVLRQIKGVDEGNAIRMSSDYQALLPAQTITAETPFVEMKLNDGRTYQCSLPEDLILEKGCACYIHFTINDNGLESITVNPNGWNGNQDDISGNFTETETDGNTDVWEGNDEDINGDSSDTETEGEGGSWNGSDNDVNGESSDTEIEGEGGSWNGSDNDVNGESSDTEIEGEGGSWNGSDNDVNGETSDTETETDGSWNGNSDNVNGETTDTETDVDGDWEGNDDNMEGTIDKTETNTDATWNGETTDLPGTIEETETEEENN